MSDDLDPGETIAGEQWGDTSLPDWVIGPARRTVCSNATGADDARQLLEMLGLVEPAPRPAPAPEEKAPAGTKPTSCVGPCGRPFRPKGTTAADYPGTVVASGLGMCGACYGRQHAAKTTTRSKIGAPRRADVPLDTVNGCKRCHRVMRPCKTPLQQQPNTVEHIAHGLCKACYKTSRKDSAA